MKSFSQELHIEFCLDDLLQIKQEFSKSKLTILLSMELLNVLNKNHFVNKEITLIWLTCIVMYSLKAFSGPELKSQIHQQMQAIVPVQF